VDGASLAVVRIALGSVAVLAAVRTWANGWTDTLYAGPTHRFTYLWLDWVPQPGPTGIRVLLAVVASAGTAVALGRRTRIASAVLLLSWGWMEAIDATTYLNHYWFVTLLAAIGTVAPMGAALGLDARRARRGATAAAQTVAVGWVWLLRFQVGIVYASAGLAKLHGDWLLRALPLRYWLPARADLPVIGGLLHLPETAHAAALAGAAFDCLVVPALLWKRSRPFAFVAVVAFHLLTWSLFPIGVFPWLMTAAATVFFEPDWPRSLARGVRRRPGHRPEPATPVQGPPAVHEEEVPRRAVRESDRPAPGWRGRVLTGVAVAWVGMQVALPLRHLAYPGDHHVTGEGYRFGWNVLLVERSGSVTFVVEHPATGRRSTADPARLYTPAQLRVMAGEPDLIQQAAQAIAADEAGRGNPGARVFVDAWMSLNGRPAERWIDPGVDLAAEPRDPWHKEWILADGVPDR
jgi:hypothetical protein